MRFRPNPRFDEEIARETAPYVQRRTRRAQDAAKASARHKTGEYRDSIRVRNEDVGATLYTTDRAGHIREWGSSRSRADRTLTNAALDEADRVEIE